MRKKRRKAKRAEFNLSLFFNLMRKGKLSVEFRAEIKKLDKRYRTKWVTGSTRTCDKELVSRIPENYEPEEIDWGAPVGKEVW